MNGEPKEFPRFINESLLVCNGCGGKLGNGDVMICEHCSHQIPNIPINYHTVGPRDISHVVPGTCPCPCHDEKILHFAPCCRQTYEPRSKLVQLDEPIHVVGDFTKFIFPLVRPKK